MIKLSKDKILQVDNHLKSEETKEVQALTPYLSEVVELSEDFTLEDLFRYIQKEQEIFNVIFASQLGHFPLGVYIEDCFRESKNKDTEIRHLEVARYIERFEYEDEIDVNIWDDFGGVGPDSNFPESGDIGWAIEFTPICDIKHLSLKINRECKMTSALNPRKDPEDLLPIMDKEDVVLGNTHFSVYELIGVILSELSFCGEPDQRDERMKYLNSEVEEIKEGLDDSNRISLTDFIQQLHEEDN